ncbi:MAG: polysaccharide deacetylase family protein [Eggerthellaceae bacterium]|nr:polysaccharide deacetylase family protein [Eggerthellaceae bacterium]
MAQRRGQQNTERTRFIGLDEASPRASNRAERASRRSPRAGTSGQAPSPGTSRGERSERNAGRAGGSGNTGRGSSRTRTQAPQTPEELRKAWYQPTFGKVVLIAIALAVIVFAAQLCSSATPIRVTVNGSFYDLRGAKTLEVALKESGLPINPGDLISLNGAVLKRGDGDPFSATVNGEETADPDFKLRNGDTITFVDGKDVVEPYDYVESPVPCGASIVGLGAIHTFTAGTDGVKELRTGKISGESVEKQTVDPVDLIETRSDPNVGDRKVIALTFDDGPSLLYTEQVLDVLAQNNAKATFFCRGDAIIGQGIDLVKRAYSEGHQICTHSYDNGVSVNGDMSLLTQEELSSEVTQGMQAISDALGVVPSKYARIGSEDLPETAIAAVAPLIDAEIGWTLDTGDWVYMAEDDIYDVLMSAKPGAIVRMHDGGGNQEATVGALKRALPKLAKQGYEFVTIDELIGSSPAGDAAQPTQGSPAAEPAQTAQSSATAESGQPAQSGSTGDSDQTA